MTVAHQYSTLKSEKLHRHIIAHSIQTCNFPSVLWRCWLGDRKGIRPVKRLGFRLLVVTIARFIAAVVTTTTVIPSSNKTQNGDVLVPANPDPCGKWPLKRTERYHSCSEGQSKSRFDLNRDWSTQRWFDCNARDSTEVRSEINRDSIPDCEESQIAMQEKNEYQNCRRSAVSYGAQCRMHSSLMQSERAREFLISWHSDGDSGAIDWF